jgi:serine protease Do
VTADQEDYMLKEGFWTYPGRVFLSLALASGLGGAGFAAVNHFVSSHPELLLKLASPSEGPSQTGFAPVVKKVLPAVVEISSTKMEKVPTEFFGQMPDDPMFRQFFGDNFKQQFNIPRQTPQQQEHGLGSGVIMTQDGYIVTNNHVIDGASDVRITLSDRREFKAKVVGTDPKADLAVLKIDATGLPQVTIGDSSKVQVGDYALAIGDPFGVGQTVTMGIISATGRSHLGIEDYEDFLQTDAPINPGNSGGALINDRGELIGINTAIIAHGSEGNQGIGFAIPVNMARNVMQQLVETGKVTRAYLGIIPQDVTPDMAKSFGEKQAQGALVGDVSANSPAQKAGLERGDIVLDVNGKPVIDSNDLRLTISMMAPGTDADLKVLRNASERDINVKLGDMPGTETAATHENNDSGQHALSGVSVENLDASAAQNLGLPATTQGVVVTNVDPSSNAADAGLRQGDVIQEVNRQPVRNTSDFERALGNSNKTPLLLVNRNGNTMYLVG